jgi:hypothetical protein
MCKARRKVYLRVHLYQSPTLSARPSRQRFSVEDKLRILDEYEADANP